MAVRHGTPTPVRRLESTESLYAVGEKTDVRQAYLSLSEECLGITPLAELLFSVEAGW